MLFWVHAQASPGSEKILLVPIVSFGSGDSQAQLVLLLDDAQAILSSACLCSSRCLSDRHAWQGQHKKSRQKVDHTESGVMIGFRSLVKDADSYHWNAWDSWEGNGWDGREENGRDRPTARRPGLTRRIWGRLTRRIWGRK